MNFINGYDVLIAGAGVAGLNCALHLPPQLKALVVCKGSLKQSDSFLAQGGICVLRGEEDFEGYFDDTLRAGHYENDRAAVRCMIENSRAAIDELISIGARFAREADGSLSYTREGAHSRPRILFHADCTGKEITSRLLAEARKRSNITLAPYTTLADLITGDGECRGGVLRDNQSGKITSVPARAVVLATGGVGGLFEHSTNFRILTGDGLALSLKHGAALEHPDYVQIHPTTLYTGKRGRRFLISESVRGEGAHLLNAAGERFVDELLPRDKVTEAIYAQMKKEGSNFVRLDLRTVKGGRETLVSHFPGIVKRCAREGYDAFSAPIPVVPAQHYFMGGIKSGLSGRTTLPRLYAVGETCCNGVHGKNRLASNSLLESLIFARRAAEDIAGLAPVQGTLPEVREEDYSDRRALAEAYKKSVIKEVRRDL